VLKAWRGAGARGTTEYRAWSERLAHAPQRAAFERQVAGALPEAFAATIDAVKPEIQQRRAQDRDPPVVRRGPRGAGARDARSWSAAHRPDGSNNTKVKASVVVTRDAFAGNYIHYGVREHGMARR